MAIMHLELAGKSAVFVRGFMDYWDKYAGEDWEKAVPLRDCQEAGKQAVEELGEAISIAYISKLARQLSQEKILKKTKKGRNYYLEAGPNVTTYWAAIEADEAWGTDLNSEALREVDERMKIGDFMKENRAVEIYAEAPLPKAMYSYLMKRFTEGKYKIIFAYADEVFDDVVEFHE